MRDLTQKSLLKWQLKLCTHSTALVSFPSYPQLNCLLELQLFAELQVKLIKFGLLKLILQWLYWTVVWHNKGWHWFLPVGWKLWQWYLSTVASFWLRHGIIFIFNQGGFGTKIKLLIKDFHRLFGKTILTWKYFQFGSSFLLNRRGRRTEAEWSFPQMLILANPKIFSTETHHFSPCHPARNPSNKQTELQILGKVDCRFQFSLIYCSAKWS